MTSFLCDFRLRMSETHHRIIPHHSNHFSQQNSRFTFLASFTLPIPLSLFVPPPLSPQLLYLISKIPFLHYSYNKKTPSLKVNLRWNLDGFHYLVYKKGIKYSNIRTELMSSFTSVRRDMTI